MIPRLLLHIIKNSQFKGKALLIYGPRQSGKTTLLDIILENEGKSALYLNCDEPDVREQLTNVTSTQLKNLAGNSKIILIDEAQRIINIGLTLKLFTDQIKDIQIIATGLSSLDLSNKINEPLTGRKFEYLLLPLSTQELTSFHGEMEEKRLIENRLIYGMYPDVINNTGNERKILTNLINSYLFKDIFAFQDIRKPEIIDKLVQALALQVGSEVSYNELSQIVGIDYGTITRYIDLLEKAFIVFRLRAYNKNLRNELKKSRKIYFYDNGIRNAVIGNFSPISLRQDKGALWENFLVSERLKWLIYNEKFEKSYFWRTKQQQEIDYIEEIDGRISAFEFKWDAAKNVKFPESFLKAYNVTSSTIIDKKNYFSFIT